MISSINKEIIPPVMLFSFITEVTQSILIILVVLIIIS